MSGLASDDITPWLPPDELEYVRSRVPMLYLDILPVRVGSTGAVEEVGLLLRVSQGGLTRALVSGRVLYHETIRQAVVRHLEKDLGPLCLPRLAPSLQPLTVGEYFPTPGQGFHDARQHAVSLVYVVPVDGDCRPQQDTLELSWLSPHAALEPDVLSEMVDGHEAILRLALAQAAR